jgi:hypothetical protein
MIKPEEKKEPRLWPLIIYGGFFATSAFFYLGRTGKISMTLSWVLALIVFVPWLGYLLFTFFKKKPLR